MTLGQIAQAQENIRNMDEPQKSRLSSESVAGLQALSAQIAEQRAQTAPAAPAAPAQEEEKRKSLTLTEAEKDRLNETADIDFDLMMQRTKSDVINNNVERMAVEKRLKPMDLTDGILTGEFKQFVPINADGKLNVTFRTITPLENEEIRRKMLEMVLEDERFSNIIGEKYGFMQTVAAVLSINGQELPKHLMAGEKGGRSFNWDIFNKKVELFMAYPGPLIHALGTHAHWFDLRVRALFTTAALKNG